MIILIDVREGLEKIQHHVKKKKIVTNLRIEGNFLNKPTQKRASIKNPQLKPYRNILLELQFSLARLQIIRSIYKKQS